LAILREVAEIRAELNLAQQEIEHRKRAEAEKNAAIEKLEATLERMRQLEDLLPICSACKKIRVEPGNADDTPRWLPLETYLHEERAIKFTHGICPSCMSELYPGLPHDHARQ